VINITVRTVTGRTAALQLTPAATVKSVKELVEMQWEIPVQEQRMVYANEELNPPSRFALLRHASVCLHFLPPARTDDCQPLIALRCPQDIGTVWRWRRCNSAPRAEAG